MIPLELMAAAGMLWTYRNQLRGREVLFFIDNQSVCCALTKGCSRSWDIQAMTTAWHLFCLEIGCRVWIEWVPSGDNPADILSREKKSLFPPTSGAVDELLLPDWVDLRGNREISRILGLIDAGGGALSGTPGCPYLRPPARKPPSRNRLRSRTDRSLVSRRLQGRAVRARLRDQF